MKTTLWTSTFALALALAASAQDRTPPQRPSAPPAKGPETSTPGDDTRRDGDAEAKEAARKAAAVQSLRQAFGEEYFAKKAAAAEELEVAREAVGADPAAFAAARTELARKYRGELAALRAAYAEKAKGLGVAFELPTDDGALERSAADASPAAALRTEFVGKVAELARSASAEVAAAREVNAGNEPAFAEKRAEIARRYRGQVVALQQAFAQRAAAQGVSVDTSDVAKVMTALHADPAASAPAPAGAPRGERATPPANPAPAPAPVPTPAPKPIDADVLRAAFLKQVDALRATMQGELATADATLKGDALAARRAEIVSQARGSLASYRAHVAARAQAAGVTLTLPDDGALVPELVGAPAEPEKPAGGPPPADGSTPPDGSAPPKPDAPKPVPPVGPGGKRTKGPRFGGGG